MTVHSRDPATWESLNAVDAAHSPDCTPPPASHRVTSYDDAVFICKDHMMTAIRGDAYGDDFAPVAFPDWPEQYVTGDTFTGYETFLEPDAKRRDMFEIRISAGHLRVGMPEYDFWWIDTDIPELAWTQGVVQFGHDAYNPTEGCNIATIRSPGSMSAFRRRGIGTMCRSPLPSPSRSFPRCRVAPTP